MHGSSVVVVNSDILPTFGVIKDIVMDSFYSLWKFYTQFFFLIIMHMKFP